MEFKAPIEDENYDFDAFIKKMVRFVKRNKIDMATSKGKETHSNYSALRF